VKVAYVVAWSIVLLIPLLRAPAVQASCVGAVVVDGSILFGYNAADWKLPPSAGRLRAVAPACNDAGQGSPDRETTVVRLRGIPADIGVRSARGDVLYLAKGSLAALAAHPRHLPSHRFVRKGCARQPALGGTAQAADLDGFALVAGGRTHFVRVDARTALVNRRAYQPVRDGQRLQVSGWRCRAGVIADRIAFVGPTVLAEPDRPTLARSGARSFPWATALLIGALCFAVVGFVVRITRP
jgi:hypothetical protein